MVTKADLHRLIDALPEQVLPIAERFFTELEADATAPHTPLHEAPLGEPEEDEPRAIADGRAAIARGDVVSHKELMRELGL